MQVVDFEKESERILQEQFLPHLAAPSLDSSVDS